ALASPADPPAHVCQPIWHLLVRLGVPALESRAAPNEPVGFPPCGSWCSAHLSVRAPRRRRTSENDAGNVHGCPRSTCRDRRHRTRCRVSFGPACLNRSHRFSPRQNSTLLVCSRAHQPLACYGGNDDLDGQSWRQDSPPRNRRPIILGGKNATSF